MYTGEISLSFSYPKVGCCPSRAKYDGSSLHAFCDPRTASVVFSLSSFGKADTKVDQLRRNRHGIGVFAVYDTGPLSPTWNVQHESTVG